MLGSILSVLGDIFQYVGATQTTGIPGAGDVSSSKLQEFMAFSRKKAGDFSLTNIYTVQFATPPMLTDQLEKGDDRLLLDYYVDSVTLPSKQITTAQIMNVGSAYKYATGNAFSQINMTFKMPKTQRTRVIFERWASLMNNDANQYTHFYNMYCCPRVRIYKFERGGGPKVENFLNKNDTVKKIAGILNGTGIFGSSTSTIADNNLLNYLKSDPAIKQSALDYIANQAKYYGCHGMWELRNVYPTNIGSVQLNNNEARVMSMTVSFNFERYRFYAKPLYNGGSNKEFIVENPALRNNVDIGNNQHGAHVSTGDANGFGFSKGAINNDNYW